MKQVLDLFSFSLFSLLHILPSTDGSSLLFFFFSDTEMGTKEPESMTVEEIGGLHHLYKLLRSRPRSFKYS